MISCDDSSTITRGPSLMTLLIEAQKLNAARATARSRWTKIFMRAWLVSHWVARVLMLLVGER